MSKKRSHGDGGIDERGPDTYRLRYRVNGKRFAITFHGTLSDARKELRRLLKSGDDGDHVAPGKLTLAQWIDRWLELKAANVRRRTLKRYRELLEMHVVPKLGNRPIQQIETEEINLLLVNLNKKLSPCSRQHIHTVLKSCFKGAVANQKIIKNPAASTERPRAKDDEDEDGAEVGQVLDRDQLTALVNGFKGSTIYEIVAMAAFTGMRRGEILALRWSDLDAAKQELRIERALEYLPKHGVTFKPPKTKRGRRTITINSFLLDLLRREREKYLRIAAGVPDGADVDLGLVRLADDALMFPAPGGDFTSPRHPDPITKQFRQRAAKLGFPGLRFHDLRGSHETLLLDNGVPVHTVAKRCGHDPAILLRIYAKRTKKSDVNAADEIEKLTKSLL